MEIVSVEPSQDGTVIYLRMDNGDLHGHAIPRGVVEQRKEAWQLPDDVDPLDLILVEAHYASEEMPEFLFGDKDYLSNREKVLGIVRKHRDKVTGMKQEARDACALPAEEAVRLRSRLRRQYDDLMAAPPHPSNSSFQASQRLNDNLRGVRLGFERMAEERLADDIISTNPDLKREPRFQPEENIGLVVKFVE